MRGTDDIRAWVITGALGSMALGVALIPLRSVVAAYNLAFVFLAFTIPTSTSPSTRPTTLSLSSRWPCAGSSPPPSGAAVSAS